MNEALTRAYDVLLNELTAWFDLTVRSLPNLVLAGLIFLVFLVLARTISRIVANLLERSEINRTMRGLLSRSVTAVVLAIGLFLILGILGLQKTVTSLLAGAGVLGLVIGLAFQDFMSNFFASILISVRRPYDEGDIIATNDHMGRVLKVNLRNTVIKNFEGQQVLVPNRLAVEKVLVNYTRYGSRRVTISVGVAYDSELDRVAETALAVLNSLPCALKEPAPTALFCEFAGSAINLKARFWISYPQTDFFVAENDAVIALHKAFAKAGIVIPFPITTLDLPEGLALRS